MLDKLKFNNLVISNQKKIQQGRTQTINKFVQKIRKLKNIIEKKPNGDLKSKERLRKSTEIMEELKKLKRVEIMKQVMVLDNPTTIITNGRSTPSEVALASLAINKIIQNLIKDFKEQLQLQDTAVATWKEELMQASKRRVRLLKTEEKRKKRKDLKDQKQMSRKRIEWLQENTNVDNKDNVNDANVQQAKNGIEFISSAGEWKEEVIEEKEQESSMTIKECAKELNKPSANANEINISKKKLKTIRNKKDTTETVKKIMTEIPKKVFKPEVHRNDVAEDVEMSINGKVVDSDHENEDVDNDKDGEEEITHIVDPFFVTEAGETYLSTAVNKHNDKQQQGQQNRTENSEFVEPLEYNNRRNRRSHTERQLPSRIQKNSNNNSFNSRQQRVDPHQNRHTYDKTDIDKKLHPSWVAKQKLKPVISSFQGKKITFNDDGDGLDIKSTTNISPHLNGKHQSDIHKNSRKDDEKEKLHPSWVAKQKLKPVITSFQGKKITFDNDE